eukprot:GILJ01006177.1.p1 GENE.GILJ01006177.1~~GILJ01006177.1.p1  ORF type:complete len:827 (-),score=101.26 GILJ01006177.1:1512-3992(-)
MDLVLRHCLPFLFDDALSWPLVPSDAQSTLRLVSRSFSDIVFEVVEAVEIQDVHASRLLDLIISKKQCTNASMCAFPALKMLVAYLKHPTFELFSFLQQLELLPTLSLKIKTELSYPFNDQVWRRFMASFPRLAELEIKSFPIDVPQDVSHSSLRCISVAAPLKSSVSVACLFTQYPHLQELRLEKVPAFHLPARCCPSVEVLHISESVLESPSMISLFQGCPNLSKLFLHKCRQVAFSQCSSAALTELSCDSLDLKTIVMLPAAFPALRSLTSSVISLKATKPFSLSMPFSSAGSRLNVDVSSFHEIALSNFQGVPVVRRTTALQRVQLSNQLAGDPDQIVSDLCRNSPLLADLEINTVNLTQPRIVSSSLRRLKLIESSLDDVAVQTVFEGCPALVSLYLGGAQSLELHNIKRTVCANLQSVTFDDLRKLSEEFISFLFASCPLHTVHLNRCTSLRQPLLHSQTLKVIEIVSCLRLFDDAVRGMFEACPHLDQATIRWGTDLICPLIASSTLTRLTIHECAKIVDDAISYLFDRCSNLVEANLINCPALVQPTLAHPSVHSLSVAECGNLSVETLLSVFLGFPSLRHVDISSTVITKHPDLVADRNIAMVLTEHDSKLSKNSKRQLAVLQGGTSCESMEAVARRMQRMLINDTHATSRTSESSAAFCPPPAASQMVIDLSSGASSSTPPKARSHRKSGHPHHNATAAATAAASASASTQASPFSMMTTNVATLGAFSPSTGDNSSAPFMFGSSTSSNSGSSPFVFGSPVPAPTQTASSTAGPGLIDLDSPFSTGSADPAAPASPSSANPFANVSSFTFGNAKLG